MSQSVLLSAETGLCGFEPIDEAHHPADENPLFQESSWVFWGDGKSTGGCVHIGQELNKGRSNIFASAFAPGIAFRRVCETYPLEEATWSELTHRAGPYSIESSKGRTSVQVREADYSLNLECHDLLPYPTLIPVFPNAVDPAIRLSSNHFQTPGRVQGEMRLGGETFEISGLANRGHSWGARNHAELRGHGTQIAHGSFGPDLSFFVFHAIRDDGPTRAGLLVERGVITHTNDIDTSLEVSADGLTYRGGTVMMKMPGGAVHEFKCSFENSTHMPHHGIELVVAIGGLSQGERTGGFCAWEIKPRPPYVCGTTPFSLNTIVSDGLSKIATV